MYGKYLLAADAIGDTAHGDGLIDAAMLLGNDGAFESLGTLAVAFLDADEDTHGVGFMYCSLRILTRSIIQSFFHIDVLTGGSKPRQRTALLTYRKVPGTSYGIITHFLSQCKRFLRIYGEKIAETQSFPAAVSPSISRRICALYAARSSGCFGTLPAARIAGTRSS